MISAPFYFLQGKTPSGWKIILKVPHNKDKNLFQIIALLAFATLAAAAPQFRAYAPQPLLIAQQPQVRVSGARDDARHAVIVRYDSDNIGVDGYTYS